MKALPRKQLSMITDSPGRALIWFAIPIMLGNLFQQLYNMVDSIVVGKFVGEQALASVGASFAITNVFIAIAIGGGIGSAVIISQYFGAKKHTQMKTAVYTALINFTIVGIVLSIAGSILCRQILTILGTPIDVLPNAVTYLQIYFWGLPFLFLYNTMSAIYNALGDSQTPLKLLMFSSVLNIILDILFVVVFHMAVAGVAIATLIAQGISSIFSFIILMKKLKEYESEKASKYSKNIARKMIRVAVPSVIQQSIVNVGILLVQSAVNAFGSLALAGYSVGMRFESICIVPMMAAGTAVSTFTAQNMGANKPERVKEGFRAGLKMIVVVAIAIVLIFTLFGDKLLTLFLDADANSVAFRTGFAYIRFESFFYVLIGLKMCTDGVLRGSGDALVFTLANLVNLTIRVWFAHTFSPIIGIQAVWYAIPIGWAFNFIISFSWYMTGRWKKRKLI